MFIFGAFNVTHYTIEKASDVPRYKRLLRANSEPSIKWTTDMLHETLFPQRRFFVNARELWVAEEGGRGEKER